MNQNQEKKNEKKAPFIITAPKQVISSAYLHISDFEEKPRFIVDENGNKVFQKLNPPPEKSNVKAGNTELLIRKIPYEDDPYERKECIARYEQLQNKVKIPCPFKCPRNHKIKEKEVLKEKTDEYGRKVIKRSLSRLLSATKSKEQTEKLNKLMVKADTLFRSRKIVNTDKQSLNVYGFDKGVFVNVDKWKNVLNTLEKKEEEELQKSKLSFQKQRKELKQQHILESTLKKKEKEVKEQKDKEIKEQRELKNKSIKEQKIQKELKYKELHEQKDQKFRNYEQLQNTSKISEDPRIDLTPKNKSILSHHQESTKMFKPTTPSSFQRKYNQQDLKNQSFHSMSGSQEINKQTTLDKSNQVQHQVISKQKSTVQTPKSDSSILKQVQQIEVKSVKSNQQSQKTDKVKMKNSIINQTQQNQSQKSYSQRLKSEEERKSNYYSEERKIQDKDERSRYSEERKSDRQKSKAKNQETNQRIIMKPQNFKRAGSFKNPNIPKQENQQQPKLRASSSGKRVQEEKPLNLNKITLPKKLVASNDKLDKGDLFKVMESEKKYLQEQQINEVNKNQSSLNNFTEQHSDKMNHHAVNNDDKLNEDSQIGKEISQDLLINKIVILSENSHSNQIDTLKEDLNIIQNNNPNENLSIHIDVKKDRQIMDDKIVENPQIIKEDQKSQDLSNNKLDRIDEDSNSNKNDKPLQDQVIMQIDKQNESKLSNNDNAINDEVIGSKDIDQNMEFIEQPVNQGLLNINDPHKNEKEKEQNMVGSGKQISIMQNSTPMQLQYQKGVSQIQSTNSLLIKQESNFLKDSLLTESLAESQFKETKGLDKQLLSSQLNEQDSINLSESQVTLKSAIQQSQLWQKLQ
ncbi:unnamed protein product [Paramecium octaurelia]|uniref:Uncharacterized protein n=1 Tax=Paramecium octaurelia TaxID=43137 RepID=A0A8S1V3V7_PAROT|nr:unnamed protein product [Paramecium octaurelia]